MTMTKAINLVNPEVMADSISAKLEKGIRFTPYAKIDDTLITQPGNTITRPRYAYIGPAEDLEEGVPMNPKQMTMSTTSVTVKEAGISIEPTETAIITNVDGTLENAANQISLSISDKIEIDYLATLDKTLLSFKGAPTTVANILSGIELFNDEEEGKYILFINTKDYNAIRKQMIHGNTFLSQEQIADLLGLSAIVKTNRTPVGTAYIQKQDAVEIVYKKRPSVSTDKDILARTVVIAANTFYATNLYNEGGVVKIKGE